MKFYTQNKRPKDMQLCQMIRRTINIDRKLNGYSWDDSANELGMSGSTLDNKLKPAKHENDITMSEFIHILEITGDMEPLAHLNSMFKQIAIPEKASTTNAQDISSLVDIAMLENNDVYNEAKRDLADGVIDTDEKVRILKELDEAIVANTNLKYLIGKLKA